jgi:hypothetical protein
LTLTLPHDVVEALRRLHPDPGWAIVSLAERLTDRTRALHSRPAPFVELAELSPGRALIIVDPRIVRSVAGVSVVAVAPHRAILAFEEGRGLADLELGLVERLQAPKIPPAARKALRVLHRRIRQWRRSGRYRLLTRSIVLVDRRNRSSRGRSPRARP